jgi:hypothetical protein
MEGRPFYGDRLNMGHARRAPFVLPAGGGEENVQSLSHRNVWRAAEHVAKTVACGAVPGVPEMSLVRVLNPRKVSKNRVVLMGKALIIFG